VLGKQLTSYILIGAIIGLFFGGMWQGISAMVLIYIAMRFDYFIRTYEKKNFEQ
jgi:hypothetical protein